MERKLRVQRFSLRTDIGVDIKKYGHWVTLFLGEQNEV